MLGEETGEKEERRRTRQAQNRENPPNLAALSVYRPIFTKSGKLMTILINWQTFKFKSN